MKNPAISVVIPCYNEERYLPACLISLKRQTFTDFEIIVIDNNCTDKTATIAQRHGARVVREKTQGMILARERGFRTAKGEIIARADADSEVSPTWLADISEAFEQNPDVVALCCGLTFPQPPRLISRFLQHIVHPGYCKICRWAYGHYPLIGCNNAIRKSAHKQITVHFNDKLVHEDLDLACHLNEVGTILYCPHILATYSMRRWKHRLLITLAEYTLRNIQTLLMHNHKYLHYRRRYRRVQSKIKRSLQLATSKVKI